MDQIVLTLAFGVLVGLSLGLVGGGGSVLTVPILVYVLGERVPLAMGTALAIVGANALIGAWEHRRAGRVRLPVAITFGSVGIVGALAGSWLNHLARERAVLVGFVVLMLGAATATARRRLGARPPAPQLNLTWRVVLAGLAVGVLTGFFGVGGGFLIVPALVLVLGLCGRHLTGHLRFGGIDPKVTVLFIIGGAVGSLLGSRLSRRINEQRLRQGFAALIVLVALSILARTVLGHPSAA